MLRGLRYFSSERAYPPRFAQCFRPRTSDRALRSRPRFVISRDGTERHTPPVRQRVRVRSSSRLSLAEKWVGGCLTHVSVDPKIPNKGWTRMARGVDFVLVGGGLQNALVAFLLSRLKHDARVVLIESAPRLGGNHTWSFHDSDLDPQARALIQPMIVRTWPRYTVCFPGLQREVSQPYSSVSSERLHEVLSSEAESNPNLTLQLGKRVTRIAPGNVETAEGDTWQAPVVVDARGPEHTADSQVLGYQKFVGIEYQVEPASNLVDPLLMDATVEQTDGYRFFYLLPLAPDRLLIEDTYYSDTPDLDPAQLREGIADYARARGIVAARALREEIGVLPLPGRVSNPPPVDRRHLVGGYGGGWFHPTTGYSFPPALRLAQRIATSELDALEPRVRHLQAEVLRQQRYCVLLNRLLFDGFEPEKRTPIFERFYRMPLSTIVHFYALQLTTGDRVRLLCGKPPPGLNPRRALSRLASHGRPGRQGGRV